MAKLSGLGTGSLFAILLQGVVPAQATVLTLDAGDLMQSTVTNGDGDFIGPTGLLPSELPDSGTYTVTPTFKSENIAGVGEPLSPYVDMVKEPVFGYYNTAFSLPSMYSDLSFQFTALFDNELQVFLNSQSIVLDDTGLGFGCTGIGPGCMDFSAPRLPASSFFMDSTGTITNPISGGQAFPYVTIDPFMFLPGANELIFALGNSGGGTGDLGFGIAISFTGIPDPSNPDDDDDGMDDTFETANGLDPFDPSDASQDLDNDALTNLEEFNKDPGLDPKDPDTDGDQIDDNLDNDPLISDNDCTGGTTEDAIFAASVTTDITCGAKTSITVDAPTIIENPGHLRLIAPLVIFNPGFKSGQLSVISKDACAACTL